MRDERIDRAAADLAAALDGLGLRGSTSRPEDHGGPDLVGEIEGVPIVVQVKAVPTITDAGAFAQTQSLLGGSVVVVADRVSAAVAERLSAAGVGWLDRRGRLVLRKRPLVVDARVRPAPLSERRSHIERFVGVQLEAALAVLDGSARGCSVRSLAAYVDRSSSAVGEALHRMREAHLVTDDLRAVDYHDLFNAVAGDWPLPERLALADGPRPGIAAQVDRLGVNVLDVDATGWALTDARAALAWGWRIVADRSAPPDYYVPDGRAKAMALATFGRAEVADQRSCTVAKAPVRLVCLRRRDRSMAGEELPVASPVVVALDLASDPARGREIVDGVLDELASDHG